jgi:GT2 family glycosyltransferase
MMIRREAFEQAGGFDARYFLYWEDADFCRRLKSLGWATAYVPGAAVTHHVGRSSKGSARSLVAFHTSAFRYFVTHTGIVGRLMSPLAALALGIRLGLKLLLRGPRRREVAP